MMSYKIYSLPQYKMEKSIFEKFISSCYSEYKLDALVVHLAEINKSYHMRVVDGGIYTFFGDLDEYFGKIETFITDMLTLLNEYLYDFLGKKLLPSDVKYTQNKSKEGSYHYSIPQLYCSCKKLKDIHMLFKEKNVPNYKYTKNKKVIDCIDTTIYCNKWFRLPLQSKESVLGSEHVIIRGFMEDFIVEYIPKYSKNIEDISFKTFHKKLISIESTSDYLFVDDPSDIKPGKSFKNIKKVNNAKKVKNLKQKVIECEPELTISEEIGMMDSETDNRVIEILSKLSHGVNYLLYKELFDQCFIQERFDLYEYWINIGMCLKNIYGMEGFELFDYYSSKGSNYVGRDEVLHKYKSFKHNYTGGFTSALIYYYAKEDNASNYSRIMYKQQINFSEVEFARKIFELSNDIFIYQHNDSSSNLKLYCYNGRYWVSNNIPLRKYIALDIYEYYKNLYDSSYCYHQDAKQIRAKIDSIQSKLVIDHVVDNYKFFGVKNVLFDNKWWLFGFTNKVLNLKTHEFRDYNPDDYISITTGYDWVEPTEEEINTVEEIIKKIMPHEDERELYKQILATGLEGRTLEKMCVFSGFGRNGKGLTDEFMLYALGDYGFQGNNSILFEVAKTGSNPELANLDKKRFVVFKEPSSKKKFENSIIKELTGGGQISARGHHETQTQKTLHITAICECNTKPKLAEEPQLADIARIIDLPFRSTFTSEKADLDEENNVYPINLELKSEEFKDGHRCALIKILIEAHKRYASNNYVLSIPDSVKERTNEYLEESCNILGWFKENYSVTLSNDKITFVYIKDIHDKFKQSEYYITLSKLEMRKYTYNYFVKYFSSNILTKKYYKLRHDCIIDKERMRYSNILLDFMENIVDVE